MAKSERNKEPSRKKTKVIKKKRKKRQAKVVEKLDPDVEKIYEKTISFMCPVRGLVTQKVKIKRYKSKQTQAKEIIKSKEDDILISVEELELSETE